MRFKGKSIVITGVATGLGRAVALLLAKEGAQFVGVDRAEPALREISETIHSNGGAFREIVGDASHGEIADRAIALCIKTYGKLDILINNAGINPTGTIADTDEETWERTIEVNLKSAYVFCHAALPKMVDQGGGVIVNTASIAGQRASKAEAAYGISKAGLIMLTRTIARDFGAQKIRANAICPGVLEGVMTDRLSKMSEEQIAARGNGFASTIPMGRLGTYEEIAKCIAFLASDDASYVNGAQLTADGGLTA